jgi:hypothetical protein
MPLWGLKFGGRPSPNRDEWVDEILRYIRDNSLDSLDLVENLLRQQTAEDLVKLAKSFLCEGCGQEIGDEVRPPKDKIPRCHADCACKCGGPVTDGFCVGCLK